MDTVRVDITYRPLRIGWAVKAGDKEAFRQAVQYSYCLWGGRANPIVVIDDLEHARKLIDLFQIDLIWPLGESEEVKEFSKHFSHLINPMFHKNLFINGFGEETTAAFLDIRNALSFWHGSGEIKLLREEEFKLYSWDAQDPLADIFSMQFGEFPSSDGGIDYRELMKLNLDAQEIKVQAEAPIDPVCLEYPSIAYLSRHGLGSNPENIGAWNSPGFFIGDATDFDDLVCYWNLKASSIPLWFVDPAHAHRYTNIIPEWEKKMRAYVANNQEWNRKLALWSLKENLDEATDLFKDLDLVPCRVTGSNWNGLNIVSPKLTFPPVSTLGFLGNSGEKDVPKVSFALSEKPFNGNLWFHLQYVVASISFSGGLHGNENYILQPPYIPELNEFYARKLYFDYRKLRIENSGIGVIVNATEKDLALNALSIPEMFQEIFSLAGYEANLSGSGLLTRQLLARLGGLQGARVFKVAGVRRLIKAHGLAATFSRKNALQLISSKDPDSPQKKFSDYEMLYIESRKTGANLKVEDVFSHLVDKGIFRLGVELLCPSCSIKSWVAIDSLSQKIECELCGQRYDCVRQLVNGEWRYRKSGVLGVEKNTKGAIPVILTLQQLDTAFGFGTRHSTYTPSLDLTYVGQTENECEIDFAWLYSDYRTSKVSMIIGECKDKGPIGIAEFSKDVENLRKVANSLPQNRFEVFILFTKLSAFTNDEVALARTLNDQYRTRVILLTDTELEPYYPGGFDESGFGKNANINSPHGLAAATKQRYFS